MISFPTSLDNFTNPAGTDPVTSPDHAQQHSDVNDAVEALEAKVGISASTPVASRVLRGTGTGTSAWAQVVLTTDVTGTLPVANGGTGAATLTGLAKGNGTSAFTAAVQGTDYYAPGGTDVAVADGGTGLSSGTSGGVLAFTASGVIVSSAELTANRLVIGGGAGAAPSVLGSLGTTTTVLHGNASGAPTFGAVVLTTDVSGVLPVANGGTNSSTALNSNRIMVSSAGAIVEAAALTNGQLLIGSTGAAPVAAAITAGTNITVTNAAGSITIASTASGGTTIRSMLSTCFETLGRFTRTLGGSGTANFDINGVNTSTGGTTSDYAKITMRIGNNGTNFKAFDQNPQFRETFNMGNVGAVDNVQGFVGIGAVTVDATGHTFTVRHIGFKVVRASSSTNLFGTVADGTTETATSALITGLTANDAVEVLADVTASGSSVSFYYRQNGGNWSSATTVTTNLPATSSAEDLLQWSVSAVSTSGVLSIVNLSSSYIR